MNNEGMTQAQVNRQNAGNMAKTANEVQKKSLANNVNSANSDRNVANNAKNVKVAADIASKSANPYAKAIGTGVKVADKISGGKATEKLGKTLNTINKMSGLKGKMMQAALNKMSESGTSDRIAGALSKKNGGSNFSALNSMSSKDKSKEENKDKVQNEQQEEDNSSEEGVANFKVSLKVIKIALIAMGPIMGIVVFLLLFVSASQVYLNCYTLGEADSVTVTDAEEKIGETDSEKFDEEVTDETVSFYHNFDENNIYAYNYNQDVLAFSNNKLAKSNLIYIDKEKKKTQKTTEKEKQNNTENAKKTTEDNEKSENESTEENSENVQSTSFGTKDIWRKYNEADLSELKSFYSGIVNYSEKYDMDTVYTFFFKLYDIYHYYKDSYDVYLDMPLIMSVLRMQDEDIGIVFGMNSKGYDRKNTADFDINKDWSGYASTKKESSHDIEILAQNMVTTSQEGDCNGEDTCYVLIEESEYKEFLREFLEKKYLTEEGFTSGNNSGTAGGSYGGTCTSTFAQYKLTDEQLEKIAKLAQQEQGTAKGAAAEASLMANLFELRGSSYGKGADGLYNYVRTSGWFAGAASHMDKAGSASPEIKKAVKSVLVDGKRTLPAYVDEHDCIVCYSDGSGDISSATNDGKSVSVYDRNSYKKNKTIMVNRYGSKYTFYSFPDTNSDPFGYTSEKIREEKGELYYDFDTGEAQNCSTGGSDLASAFVALTKEQLNDAESRVGGKKYWQFMGFNYRVAWCAAFVSWNIENTSYKGQRLKDILKIKSATVNQFMDYFYKETNPNVNFYYNDNCYRYKGKNGSKKTYTPKPGDIIFFDNNSSWSGRMPRVSGDMNGHVGIVEYTKDGIIHTIEGNSGDMTRTREYSIDTCHVVGFGSWY